MNTSEIMKCAARVLYPFMLLYGFYIILFGDRSPGGGFQGGAIFATAYLVTIFLPEESRIKRNTLAKIEKVLFMIIILIAFSSYFTRGILFTNFIPGNSGINDKRIFLVLLNFFISLKVATGLILIISAFVEEGKVE